MKQSLTNLAVALSWAGISFAVPAPVPQASSPAQQSIPPTFGAPTRSIPIGLPHAPFTGTPTVTGALSTSALAQTIAPKPPNPTALGYPSNGQLTEPMPMPYMPAGGLGTDGTEPVYNVRSDFDYQSLALALYQEWIELDLFHHGLAMFSEADFTAAGLTPEDRYLIQFMAEQEIGHITVISNMLGAQAPMACAYNYPFTTVREFVDFCQKFTRFAESSVYGFINHLDSREAAQLLLQSISTEARQQQIFRQFDGLFPMPVWFEVAIPQSWAWTLVSPYISWCPEHQTRLTWQNFPSLRILNQPNPARVNGSAGFNETLTAGMNSLKSSNLSPQEMCLNHPDPTLDCGPAITQNRSIPLSWPGRVVELEWEMPGLPVGPNNSYITSTSAGQPQFVAWVSQLNVTYSPLTLLGPSGGPGGNATGPGGGISGNATVSRTMRGRTVQPNVATFQGDPAVNGTMFIAVMDSDLHVTPFNTTMLNPHVVAGPALYQAG